MSRARAPWRADPNLLVRPSLPDEVDSGMAEYVEVTSFDRAMPVGEMWRLTRPGEDDDD
ncbi:MAG: hypothetical protein NUW01_12965 [Gemmatimonadaceae bacterium]|nr:hypothetical protein [Gemmatimonadaceae bacterium]